MNKMNFKQICNNKIEKKSSIEIKVISDLEYVELEEKAFAERTEKEFKVSGFFNEDKSEFYRFPKAVISQITAMLSYNPNIKIIAVKKSGIGMNAQYTVTQV